MANKRELKQTINYVCAELLSETFVAGMLEKNIEKQISDHIDKLSEELVKLQKSLKSHLYLTSPLSYSKSAKSSTSTA